MFSQQYFLTYTVVFTGRIMDCERSVIEEAHIHIFGFTHRKNNQFEKKLMRQNTNKMNMPFPPPPSITELPRSLRIRSGDRGRSISGRGGWDMHIFSSQISETIDSKMQNMNT